MKQYLDICFKLSYLTYHPLPLTFSSTHTIDETTSVSSLYSHPPDNARLAAMTSAPAAPESAKPTDPPTSATAMNLSIARRITTYATSLLEESDHTLEGYLASPKPRNYLQTLNERVPGVTAHPNRGKDIWPPGTDAEIRWLSSEGGIAFRMPERQTCEAPKALLDAAQLVMALVKETVVELEMLKDATGKRERAKVVKKLRKVALKARAVISLHADLGLHVRLKR